MKKLKIIMLMAALTLAATAMLSCSSDDGDNSSGEGFPISSSVGGGISSGSSAKFTVTFNANGATGTNPLDIAVGSDSIITLPSQGNMAMANYSFSGWNTESSGTGTKYSAGEPYTVDGTITLYAQWVPAKYGYLSLRNISGRNEYVSVTSSKVNETESVSVGSGNTVRRTYEVGSYSVKFGEVRSTSDGGRTFTVVRPERTLSVSIEENKTVNITIGAGDIFRD